PRYESHARGRGFDSLRLHSLFRRLSALSTQLRQWSLQTGCGTGPPARAVRGSRGKRAEAQERAFSCQSGGERGKEVACAGQAATRRLPKGPSFVSSVTVLSRTAAQAVGVKICPRPSFARHAALLGGLQGCPLTSRAASAKQRKQQARELGLCPSPR